MLLSAAVDPAEDLGRSLTLVDCGDALCTPELSSAAAVDVPAAAVRPRLAVGAGGEVAVGWGVRRTAPGGFNRMEAELLTCADTLCTDPTMTRLDQWRRIESLAVRSDGRPVLFTDAHVDDKKVHVISCGIRTCDGV